MISLLGARPKKLKRTLFEIFSTKTPHSHRLPLPLHGLFGLFEINSVKYFHMNTIKSKF